MKETFNWFIASISAILLFLYGKIDTSLIVFFIAILTDFITGICKGIYERDLSSKYGMKGLLKKFCMCILVAFTVQLDKLIGSEGMIRNFIIFYYVSNEGISILENLVAMNIPFPDKLKDILLQVNEKGK